MNGVGVQIDSVGLESGKPYVSRLSPAHIKFNLTLDREETLQSVVWQRDDRRGSYEWEANGNVSVSGILQGAINTSATNGELHFPSAEYDHAGVYNLTVFTSNGSDTAAYKLIVYYFSIGVSSLSLTNCTWSLRVLLYEVAPYPNVSCVFEWFDGWPLSVPLDSIAQVQELVTDNKNGTFTYELASDLPVQKVTMESSISCQFWIEDSSIPSFQFHLSGTAQPCPEPDTKTDLNYTIVGGFETCYKGYGLYSRVTYFCKYDPNLEPQKTLECRSGGRWVETDTTPWPDCSSGTSLTFHLKLLAATFLIASYYAVK